LEKTSVTVTVFGREYSIKSEVDPDYIKKAADYLNSKMQEIADSYPNISENRVAVLAALNITYELFQSPGRPGDQTAAEEIIVRLTQKLSDVM
jgi:cell division protein ZapA